MGSGIITWQPQSCSIASEGVLESIPCAIVSLAKRANDAATAGKEHEEIERVPKDFVYIPSSVDLGSHRPSPLLILHIFHPAILQNHGTLNNTFDGVVFALFVHCFKCSLVQDTAFVHYDFNPSGGHFFNYLSNVLTVRAGARESYQSFGAKVG
jgi:hypothetical protein